MKYTIKLLFVLVLIFNSNYFLAQQSSSQEQIQKIALKKNDMESLKSLKKHQKKLQNNQKKLKKEQDEILRRQKIIIKSQTGIDKTNQYIEILYARNQKVSKKITTKSLSTKETQKQQVKLKKNELKIHKLKLKKINQQKKLTKLINL